MKREIIDIVVSNVIKHGTIYDIKESSRKEIKERFQLDSNYDFGNSIVMKSDDPTIKVYIYSKEPKFWEVIKFNLTHELRDYKLNKLV